MKKRIIFPEEKVQETINFELISKDSIVGMLTKHSNGEYQKVLLLNTDYGYTCLRTDLNTCFNWYEQTKTASILRLKREICVTGSFVFDTNEEALIWLIEKHE